MKKRTVTICGLALWACSVLADNVKPWFDGGVAEGFPNAASMSGGAWSNVTGQASYSDGKVKVAADVTTPLTFSADTAQVVTNADVAAGTTTQAVVSATITFTPFSSAAKPAIPEDSEIGMILVDDGGAYYMNCVKNGEWVQCSTPVTASPDVPLDVKVIVCCDANGSVDAQYWIGTGGAFVQLDTNSAISNTTLRCAKLSGCSEIASLSATFCAKDVVKPTPYSPISSESPEEDARQINEGGTAAKKEVMSPPAGVTMTNDAYYTYFDAIPVGSGEIAMVLNATGTNAVTNAVHAVEVKVLEAALATEASFRVDDPIAGFYYSLKQGGDLTNLVFRVESDRDKIGGKDEIRFELDEPEGAGFYQPIVTPTPTK